MADILSQVGIKVTADTKAAVEAFRQMENAQKKVGAASEFIGKVSGALDKAMIPLLGVQTALMGVRTAIFFAKEAWDIYIDLIEEASDRFDYLGGSINAFLKQGRAFFDFVRELDNRGAVAQAVGEYEQQRQDQSELDKALSEEKQVAEERKREHAARLKRIEELRLKMTTLEHDTNVFERALGIGKFQAALPTEAEIREQLNNFLDVVDSVSLEVSEARASERGETLGLLQSATGGAYQAGDGPFPVDPGDPFGRKASQSQAKAGSFSEQWASAERAKKAQAFLDAMTDRTHYAGAAYGALSDGIAASVDAAITGSESIGKAMARAAAASLKATATEAAVKALWETAQGTAALALGPIGGVSAAAHFKAAGIYAATAVAAGVGASALGSASGSWGGGGGGTSAGGGYIGPRQTGDGGNSVTVIVQGDVYDGDALAEKVERATRRAVASGRVRGGSSGQMVERV